MRDSGSRVISDDAEPCCAHISFNPVMSFCNADPNESREPRCLFGGTAQPDAHEHRPGRAGREGTGGVDLRSCGFSPRAMMAWSPHGV